LCARSDRYAARRTRTGALDPVEVLEGRELLSKITVTSLRGAEIGSRYPAIVEPYQRPAPNTIDINVHGIRGGGRQSHPAIREQVTLDRASALAVGSVSSVRYYNADSVRIQPVSSWTGIRDAARAGEYLITGTSNDQGLLYVGPISGRGGKSLYVNYPGASVTSLYGPDLAGGNVLRLVGTYSTSNSDAVHGFVFQGTVADLSSRAHYRTIDYPHAKYTYVHSTMGDLAVGNGGDIPANTDHAFIYSLSQRRVLTDIVYPDGKALGTSVYGVWYDGGTRYTVAGGYTSLSSAGKSVAEGYLVDYNEATGRFSHWTSFAGPDGLVGPSVATHFQGISSPAPGVYTLSAAMTDAGSTTVFGAALAIVRRDPDGTFGPAKWASLHYPGAVGIQSANSVAGNQIVGIATTREGTISYQATVTLQSTRS
jgi:hypothetical protein